MKSPRPSTWLALALLAAAILGPHDALTAPRALVPTPRLETGRLLVARPGMLDPNFSETVVLLLAYGDDGAMGVIVNRPTRVPLSEILPDVGLLAERPEVAFSGGPVAVHHVVFTLRTASARAGCRPVLADVCAGGSLELLEEALADGETEIEFRGFLGHAGWAPGQLEWEIDQSGWYVLPGDSRRIFDSAPDELWPALVRLAESPVA